MKFLFVLLLSTHANANQLAARIALEIVQGYQLYHQLSPKPQFEEQRLELNSLKALSKWTDSHKGKFKDLHCLLIPAIHSYACSVRILVFP